ncbi:MAG TPA: HPr family phosphocarrier protein [Clostridiales bacterium]|jgi:phosphotransferase system HPr-like phosphotransfer protein|nr:HPr family phosphocarrier protein [Clostridiales bacterium]
MKNVKIRLESAQDVKNFVAKVSNCAHEIDLKSGRHNVDAKSILGIFSLDLSKPATLSVHCKRDNCKECSQLFQDIKEYIVD